MKKGETVAGVMLGEFLSKNDKTSVLAHLMQCCNCSMWGAQPHLGERKAFLTTTGQYDRDALACEECVKRWCSEQHGKVVLVSKLLPGSSLG